MPNIRKLRHPSQLHVFHNPDVTDRARVWHSHPYVCIHLLTYVDGAPQHSYPPHHPHTWNNSTTTVWWSSEWHQTPEVGGVIGKHLALPQFPMVPWIRFRTCLFVSFALFNVDAAVQILPCSRSVTSILKFGFKSTSICFRNFESPSFSKSSKKFNSFVRSSPVVKSFGYFNNHQYFHHNPSCNEINDGAW